MAAQCSLPGERKNNKQHDHGNRMGNRTQTGEIVPHLALPSKERSGRKCSRTVILRDVLCEVHHTKHIAAAVFECRVHI